MLKYLSGERNYGTMRAEDVTGDPNWAMDDAPRNEKRRVIGSICAAVADPKPGHGYRMWAVESSLELEMPGFWPGKAHLVHGDGLEFDKSEV
jgi:hypothetical protein